MKAKIIKAGFRQLLRISYIFKFVFFSSLLQAPIEKSGNNNSLKSSAKKLLETVVSYATGH